MHISLGILLPAQALPMHSTAVGLLPAILDRVTGQMDALGKRTIRYTSRNEAFRPKLKTD